MQLELLVAFTTIFLIDSVSPGPASAAVVARSASTGIQRTAPFIAGLVAGDLVLFALAVGGLAALAAAMGALFAFVKWLGIAYLLYLGYQMWTSPPKELSKEAPEGEGTKLFVLGALLPLGNPKAIGFYVALLPTVLDVSALSMNAALTLSSIIAVIWAGVLFGYALFADRAGKFVSSPKGQRILNRSSAGAMVFAAGTIAARES